MRIKIGIKIIQVWSQGATRRWMNVNGEKEGNKNSNKDKTNSESRGMMHQTCIGVAMVS